MWPTDDVLLAAWRDLVADPDTAGRFAELVLPPLEQALRARWPRVDGHECAAAAGDAVLAVVKHLERYDPERRPVRAYLRMIAKRRLINRFAAEARHQRGRIPWDDVELGVAARNSSPSASPFDTAEWQAVLARLSEADAQVFALMRDGVRRTSAYAAALGLADRTEIEQRAEVKRAKDRILVRLKRVARTRGGNDA